MEGGGATASSASDDGDDGDDGDDDDLDGGWLGGGARGVRSRGKRAFPAARGRAT